MQRWGWSVLALCLAGTAMAEEHLEVNLQGDRTVVFRFPEPMQTLATQTDTPRPTFTPARNVTACHWADDTRLSCELDKSLPRATRFRIALPAQLRTLTGAPLPTQTVTLETARPALWINQAWESGHLRIYVSTWKTATQASIVEALRMTLDGKPVKVVLKPVPRSYGDAYYEVDVPQVTREATLEFALVGGVVSSEGPLRGKPDPKRVPLRAILGESFRVRGAACAGGNAAIFAPVKAGRIDLSGCMPGEQIRVLFSRSIDSDAMEAWRTTWPANLQRRQDQAFGYARGGDGVPQRAPDAATSFEIDTAHAHEVLSIPALPEKKGDDRLAPVELRVSTGATRPSFIAPFSRALLLRDGEPGLKAVNAPPVTVDTFAIARGIDRSASQSPRSGEVGNTLLPTGVRQALADGGYATMLPHRIDGPVEGGMQVAAPDFDVHVKAGTRSVLAWVNAWDGDAPIANADAVLLLDDHAALEPRVLATGRTDAQGLVRLQLPADFRMPKKKNGDPEYDWYVRIERGRGRAAQRAVLPIDGPRSPSELGDAPEKATWGVVDRPLYRAGDTIHWTVWWREDDGGRFVASKAGGARTLHLMAEDDRNLLSWQSTFDGEGRATGDTRIPIHVPDGDYCIGDEDDAAVCFHIGTFRPQDLWARASTAQTALRSGDTLAVDFETGFYSGGSGAGIAVEGISAVLEAVSPAVEFPQWRGFAFAPANDSEDIDGLDEITLATDAKGRATLKLPLDKRFEAPGIALGALFVSAEASPADREGTHSNSIRVRYASRNRFVGLRVDGDVNDAKAPVAMTAVVIDADGKEIAGARVELEVKFGAFGTEPAVSVHRCTLVSGASADCTFPRTDSGRYLIEARSDDAIATQVDRWVWTSSSRGKHAKPDTLEVKEVEGDTYVVGKPVRVEVRTPVFPTRALVTISHGKHVIDQQVVTLAAAVQAITLPTRADMPLKVGVDVLVRRTDAPARTDLPEGFRQPIPTLSDGVALEFQRAEASSPVTVAFERAQAAPAETVKLRLRNDAATPRSVTLAVTDDALRSLGTEWVTRMDPARTGFRTYRAWDSADDFGFGDWNRAPLRWVLARPPEDLCKKGCTELDTIVVVGAGAINPIDVTSVESTTALTNEQVAVLPVARDTTSVALLAPGSVRTLSAAALPAAPEEPPVVFDEPSPVDVQGNRPKDASKKSGAPRPDRAPSVDHGAARARIRTEFADTALWRSDIVLAPGETRTIDLVVPDNLTRWRAVAWSSDAGDDFAMAEATLEAGLPVEARLQSPVRIYTGDTTRLALNVRQIADHASEAEARVHIAEGDNVAQWVTTLEVPAAGQSSVGTRIAPTRPGTLLAIGAAATAEGRDAVAASIEVASTTILGTKTQAGWIGDAPVSLDLPALPHGAHDAHVHVGVWRGANALIEGWTDDMRVYPHRCWEQILSRAVAAALAIERGDSSWPDAKAVVQEAIDNASAFQTDVGGMRYFNGRTNYAFDEDDGPNLVPLTAWTVDAFALLRSLGYKPNEQVDEQARAFLAQQSWRRNDTQFLGNEIAIAAAVVELDAKGRDAIAAGFDKLSLPARIAAARTFARGDAPQTREAFDKLLAMTTQRGTARSFDRNGRFDRWMGSPRREQCEFIRLLDEFPQYAPAGVRSALIAGLADLYAGGVGAVDTQTGASCLRALRGEGTSKNAGRIVVDATLAARADRITVESGEVRNQKAFALSAAGALTLAPVERPDAPVAFLARVEYQEDARQAQPSAMGFSITRMYDVKRDTKWVPLGEGLLREGDWVRITLTIDNAAERYFVAVTDDLPGGLRPVDMGLSGVSGAGAAGDGNGSYYFDERKLDPRKPKFYAQRLPIGRHEIQYYARVGNTGEYLAAPAVVELMYGEASRARTAADRVRIAGP